MTMKFFMLKSRLYYMLLHYVLHILYKNCGFLYMCVYTTRDGMYNYNYHATLRLWEALLAPDFRRKSRVVVSCFML